VNLCLALLGFTIATVSSPLGFLPADALDIRSQDLALGPSEPRRVLSLDVTEHVENLPSPKLTSEEWRWPLGLGTGTTRRPFHGQHVVDRGPHVPVSIRCRPSRY
jgi:hypothetical protein